MRVHERISLSAVSTWSWSLEEDLRFWSESGIKLVGVSAAKLRASGLDRGVRQILESGVRVSNLLGPGPFDLASPKSWQGQREGMAELVDAANELDAGCLVVTTGCPGDLTWERAADSFADAVAPVLDLARDLGVRVALEHTNSLRPDIGFLQSLRDAVDLARRLAIGVCMETNACWLERDLEGTIARGTDTLRLVQVSDFVIGTKDTPNRAVPGDGDIPLERIISQVVSSGYGGPFDLELIGPRIEQEGYRSAVERSVAWLNRTLDSVGA